MHINSTEGARGGATALQAGKSPVPLPMLSLEFFIDIILPPHYGQEVHSVSQKTALRIFLASKGSRTLGLILPPSCVDYLEIWEQNLGACTGIALPF
jgi:hypothetical protein